MIISYTRYILVVSGIRNKLKKGKIMIVNTYSEQAEVTSHQMHMLWALFSQIETNIKNGGNMNVTKKLATVGNYLAETWACELEEIHQELEHAENNTFDRSEEKI